MFHRQIQQVQQRINSVSQMASQLRQSEENNRQRLMQLAQDEAYASQQMNRIQQLCQESMTSLQNISAGTTGQQSFTGVSQTPAYGQSYSPVIETSPQFQQHPSSLFNPATMGPDTYQNVMQYMGGQSYSGVGQMGSTGQIGQTGQLMGTESSLSNISTMGPDVYQASREQLGKGPSSLGQVGQQAGINTQGTATTRLYNQ
jgi:hypothetical protein